MRKVFIVTASGSEAQGHYQDTIIKKRNPEEISKFISLDENKQLDNIYHGRGFAIWGATPGSGNTNTWSKMSPGDYVVFYQQGKFILIGEVAYKVKNKELANFLWGVNNQGETWENTYFIINEAIKFLSYEKIRDLDEKFSDMPNYLTTEMVVGSAEIINNHN